jgi:hypothetical protein
MLTLDEALRLLREGRSEEVAGQLPGLLAQLHPLLAYGSARLQLGFEHGLGLLQDRIAEVRSPEPAIPAGVL